VLDVVADLEAEDVVVVGYAGGHSHLAGHKLSLPRSSVQNAGDALAVA